MEDKIRVAELFAGVGGFRLGLEGFNGYSAQSNYKRPMQSSFETVWSNQYEPGGRIQYASDIYRFRWPDTPHSNEDIFPLAKGSHLKIPDHDLIVGGFPCQDYSVANTLKRAGGIEGQKGVLWWAIHRILSRLIEEGRPTKYLMLENVDRLLKSPRGQRGRDFAVMLASLAQLNYAVEWRIINAADYGMPQRRRRVFILAYHDTTEIYDRITRKSPQIWKNEESIADQAFPIQRYDFGLNMPSRLVGSLPYISRNFNLSSSDRRTPFHNSGIMVEREFWTYSVATPPLSESQITESALGKWLENGTVGAEFWVPEETVFDAQKGWLFYKGAKSRERVDKETGHRYEWSEGGMQLFDDLSKPARTVITSEGGKSPSRSTHLIRIGNRFRRLTPVELERISMFPDDHTRYAVGQDGKVYEVPNAKRAFLIGNALVAGVVESLGRQLATGIRRSSQAEAKSRAAEIGL